MKLIIDVDEDNYNAICSDKGYSYANTMWWIIRNGTPYNLTGDCISREALKKTISELPNANPSYWNKCDVVDRQDVLDEIDNAPPISERQKGEWKFNKYGSFYCSVCNGEPYDQYGTTAFCPFCGADLRKGGAE